MSRVIDLLRNTVALNLRYSSTLLYLSKDYLKDVSAVLAKTTDQAAPQESETVVRAPLLIAGYTGDTATGAFALDNTSDREMRVQLVVQCELDARLLQVTPAVLDLKPGTGAVVRIIVKFDEAIDKDRDYRGFVTVPGLSNEGVPFIVRRLYDLVDAKEKGADETAPAAEVKSGRKTAKRSAKKSR